MNHNSYDQAMFGITLQQMAAFIEIAEHLNFTRAAEAMYISQPALSRIISRFEKSVNAKLFIRKSRGIELTTEGQMLYDELAPLFAKMTSDLNATNGSIEKAHKALRIACHTSFDLKEPYNSFRAAIEKFEEKYPGTIVAIQLFELTELKDSLLDGDIDLIYSVSTTFENLDALSYKTIESVQVYAAMSEYHPLASARTLTPEMLAQMDFYFISSANTEKHMELCKQFGFTPRTIIPLHNYPSVIMAIRQGKGLTLCGIDVKYTYGADIKFVELPASGVNLEMVLAWNPENSSTVMYDFLTMLP